MHPTMNLCPSPSGSEDGLLRTLSSLAHNANSLAKLLRGSSLQPAAYRLKNEACSALLLLNGAVVNGRQADHDLLGLDILNPPSQIHCRYSQLEPEARAIAVEQASLALAKGSIRDRLRPEQLQQLDQQFPSKRRAA